MLLQEDLSETEYKSALVCKYRKNYHSLQKDRLQNVYSAANSMHVNLNVHLCDYKGSRYDKFI